MKSLELLWICRATSVFKTKENSLSEGLEGGCWKLELLTVVICSYGIRIVLAVLLNWCNVFCGKDRENFLPEDQVGFQTFGHIMKCIGDIQRKEDESWTLAIPSPHAPGLYSVTTFTCNLFELLFVKQDVIRKKESPNSIPKNEPTTMMSSIHLSTLKHKNVHKIKSNMWRTWNTGSTYKGQTLCPKQCPFRLQSR